MNAMNDLEAFPTTRDVSHGMDLSTETLIKHVHRGTITAPMGYVKNRGNRHDFIWEPGSAPALDLLGATGLVAASEELALKELDAGYYATPSRSNRHLGRYDGVSALGLCNNRRADFYPVTRIIRVGYLDPVREGGSAWECLPLDEGDRILDDAQLSPADRATLREVCTGRANYHEHEDAMIDPREITVYVLDRARPIAREVKLKSIVQGFGHTVDPVNEHTEEVDTCKLDAVADWARKVAEA